MRKKAKQSGKPAPDEWTMKEKALIEKMKAAGKSKEEIKQALDEMHKKVKKTGKPAKSPGEKDMMLIEKMKKAGLTDEEIKRVIKELQQMKEQAAKSAKKKPAATDD